MKKTTHQATPTALGRLLSRLTGRRPPELEPSRSRAIVTWLTGGKTRSRRTRRRLR